MERYSNYREAEAALIWKIVHNPSWLTETTYERLGEGFMLINPADNKNDHSNYEYADKFFKWLMSGQKELSEELIDHNPWVKRFMDTSGLPDNFSSSYSHKIMSYMDSIVYELEHKKDSRRAYVNILYPADVIIREAEKTTHEYPCTIGYHLFIRHERLHMVVNMRSQNVWKVMPYDVYNFTMIQLYMCEVLEVKLGNYYHIINSAHIYNGDVRRILSSSKHQK